MPVINSPALVAELTALHDSYEAALAAHDTATLAHLFWDSPDVVRFGVNEHLYGAAAIAAYRQSAGPTFRDRILTRRTVTTFGSDAASIMCELTQTVAGQPRHSRQSQTWIRFPDLGWKIVAAHVSNALVAPPGATSWETYVDQSAAAISLPLSPEHRLGVVQNLQRSAAIVAPLLAVDLPDTVELPAVFTP